MTEKLGMADRVRLEEEADHIGVWPDTRLPGAEPGAASNGDEHAGRRA
jgi:hypothetical protein